ncbi:hypothetical protein J1605_013263 [Eschrichtius robustus]|uniref:Uncharacterized protein n=1 Tax=Eschrichtius robustus TaxID=9764 RepID=A0AB34GEX3_ESCRO|nr:hypothetical protein J1605_013263 [Eschrichtius robustus]
MRMEEPGGQEVRRADFAFLPPLFGAFPLLWMECGRGRGRMTGTAGQRPGRAGAEIAAPGLRLAQCRALRLERREPRGAESWREKAELWDPPGVHSPEKAWALRAGWRCRSSLIRQALSSHVSVRPVAEFSEFPSEERKVRELQTGFSVSRGRGSSAPASGADGNLAEAWLVKGDSRHRRVGASLVHVRKAGRKGLRDGGGDGCGEQPPQRTGQFHAGSAARPLGTPSPRAPSERPGWDAGGTLKVDPSRQPPATLKEKKAPRVDRAAEQGLELSSLARHQAPFPSPSLQPGGECQQQPVKAYSHPIAMTLTLLLTSSTFQDSCDYIRHPGNPG